MIYYISDTHFYDEEIIKNSKRPFNSLEEMHSGIIKSWNSRVRDGDLVYILGDFSVGSSEQTANLLEILKGRKILIFGNNDHFLSDPKFLDRYGHLFEKITPYTRIVDSGKNIVLFHYPIAEWDDKYFGTLHFHGHTHNYNPYNCVVKNSYNVCVEKIGYIPRTLNEILNL